MFSDEIIYQLDFAKTSSTYYIIGIANEYDFQTQISNLKSFLETTNSKKISIVNAYECFSSENYIKNLLNLIDNYPDKKIYISSTTSTIINNYFYKPLVNIYFWNRYKCREDMLWKPKKWVELFREDLYKPKPKTNKGILSVRKYTKFRSYLFSLIDLNSFEGITRYAKWSFDASTETIEMKNKNNNFPKILEILDEYKKSYISFVIETDLSDFMNYLTEKTLIAFLTRTMPIVLGGKNYVKELKDMGFYVWNDEFGFDGDSFESLSNDKAISYNKCIENYNKMSKSDIVDMYNSNIDKIENNYKIVSSILFDKKEII